MQVDSIAIIKATPKRPVAMMMAMTKARWDGDDMLEQTQRLPMKDEWRWVISASRGAANAVHVSRPIRRTF
jgi:hypothetical protein